MIMSAEGGRDDEENNSPSSPAPKNENNYPRRSVLAIGCACFVAGFLLGVMFLGGYRSFLAVGSGSSESLHGGSSSIFISDELAEDEIAVDDIKNSSSSAKVSIQTFAMESTNTLDGSDNEHDLGSLEKTIQNVVITNNYTVSKQVNHDRSSFT